MEIIERLNEWGTRDTERGKQLYKDIQDAIQKIQTLTQQRDELLAALKDLVPLAMQAMSEANNDGAGYTIDEELKDARAVIAKCEA